MPGSNNNNKKKNKSSFSLFYVFIAITAICFFILYKIFSPNTGTFTKGEYLYVHTGADYAKVYQSLIAGGFIKDNISFNFIAHQAQLHKHLHPGKYVIKQGMSNFDIIRLIRSGKQIPIKLVINKLRTKHDFTTLVATNLEADSNTINQLLQDKNYLKQFEMDTNTIMCGIIPDTYEFFWNTSADKVLKKIEKNYTKFWDATRKAKAKALGLNPVKATIIASIIEEETNINEDKPVIASVYLNRLNKGMKLQADPTVKFAIGDFAIKRVTGGMLNTDSRYNTYMYAGLPPGPICTPSLSSINAVLDPATTNYLYFCAKPDFSGYSAFATTLDQQMKNAKLYQKALNDRGIK